ncbi:cell adhesion molecule 3-like isoform X2 [Coccinella septempunctata]|uniref:cell adhesion molecule 3-like isoform X2 n=1 Tax=Coccinella septempunctata TaxID=41139 RepID=UPI001D06C91A|nr:cell adhesion molecule 3-like isoform X2 [Coccinella septempunctata]
MEKLGCLALKDLKIYVPMAVIRGHDAILNCTYDLEGDDLYSVKWYRHGREFFRYTPNDEKPIKQFKIQGLSLEVRENESTATRIVLVNADQDITGMYSCEVTADQPSFFTDMKKSHLEVVELPRSDPHISGFKTKYRVGEILRANCTSGSSYPAVNLTWYVNDQSVDSTKVKKHTRIHADGHFQSADSILRLPIVKQLFSRGRLKIRCVASLHDVYYRSSEKSAELEKKKHRGHYAHVITLPQWTSTSMTPMVQWGIMPQASERHPADTTLIFETRQRPTNGSTKQASRETLILFIIITSVLLLR